MHLWATRRMRTGKNRRGEKEPIAAGASNGASTDQEEDVDETAIDCEQGKL